MADGVVEGVMVGGHSPAGSVRRGERWGATAMPEYCPTFFALGGWFVITRGDFINGLVVTSSSVSTPPIVSSSLFRRLGESVLIADCLGVAGESGIVNGSIGGCGEEVEPCDELDGGTVWKICGESCVFG